MCFCIRYLVDNAERNFCSNTINVRTGQQHDRRFTYVTNSSRFIIQYKFFPSPFFVLFLVPIYCDFYCITCHASWTRDSTKIDSEVAKLQDRMGWRSKNYAQLLDSAKLRKMEIRKKLYSCLSWSFSFKHS